MICDIVYDQQDVIFTTDIDLKKFSAGKEIYVSYEKDTEDNFDLRFLVLRKKKLGNEHRVTMHSDRSFRVHDIKEESEYNFMKKFYYRIFDDEILFFELHSGNLYPALDGTKNLPEKINNKIIYYSDKYLYEKKAIFDSFHQENLKYYDGPCWFIFRTHYLDFTYLNDVRLEKDEIDFFNKNVVNIYLSEPILTLDIDSQIVYEDEIHRVNNNILYKLSNFAKVNNIKEIIVNLCEGNFPSKSLLYPRLTFKYNDIFLRYSAIRISKNSIDTSLSFNKKFCSPNWIFRPHRYIIASYLSNKESYISWAHKISSGRYDYNEIYYNNLEFFREIEPFFQFVFKKDELLANELLDSSNFLEDKVPVSLDNHIILNNDENDYTRQTNNGFSSTLNLFYKNSFCGVVTETVYDYPYSNISEKILLPVANRRPFILVAAKESLKAFKSLGFKTFDLLWDETYDELNANERMYCILKIISKINQTPLNELKDMLYSIRDILDHNYKLLMEIHERT